MTDKIDHFDLDHLSTDELNELLRQVMVKLRHRDVADLRQDIITKSQRLTLSQNIAQHLDEQRRAQNSSRSPSP
jgi:hypothetical protein